MLPSFKGNMSLRVRNTLIVKTNWLIFKETPPAYIIWLINLTKTDQPAYKYTKIEHTWNWEWFPPQDGLSSGHASDLDDELDPELHIQSVLSSQARRGDKDRNGHAATLSSLLALSEPPTTRLPPPSPAPECPPAPASEVLEQGSAPSVAAAIKDIKKAIQSAKTLHSTPGCGPVPPDPWLPRGAPVEAPLPAPPTSPPPSPPSPACSTPPPPPPLELQEETESEVEEERVPTPEVMKKDDEDLDTDQVTRINYFQTLVGIDMAMSKDKHNQHPSSDWLSLAGDGPAVGPAVQWWYGLLRYCQGNQGNGINTLRRQWPGTAPILCRFTLDSVNMKSNTRQRETSLFNNALSDDISS